MSYTQYQCEVMDIDELLDLVESESDELTTTPAERALITHVRDNLIFYSCGFTLETLADIEARLPKEDFLADAVELAHEISNGKMSKPTMVDAVKKLSVMLEDIQAIQADATAFALNEISTLTKYDSTRRAP